VLRTGWRIATGTRALRSGIALTAAAVVVLTLASGAWTRNIVGTPHNDVLRGTAAADVINGKGGNDTISGLAGNDRLIGGPGNDTIRGGPGADAISCGPGKDTVYADTSDTIAGDCESVKGLPAPKPPPLATAGHYLGTTSQGNRIGFDVADDGASLSNLSFRLREQCMDTVIGSFGITLSLSPDGSLTVDGQGAFTGALPPGGLVTSASITGTFSPAHAASGSFQVVIVDAGDPTNGHCTSGTVTWNAQPSAFLVPPGQYAASSNLLSAQGPYPLSLEVAADGQNVMNLKVEYVAPCQPGGQYHATITWAGPLVIQPDRTWTITGTTADGVVTGTITASFDTAGDVGGTYTIHAKVDQDGTHYECDTGTVQWAGLLQ
jgi:hypothetical protein